jgi:hypothetical protein
MITILLPRSVNISFNPLPSNLTRTRLNPPIMVFPGLYCRTEASAPYDGRLLSLVPNLSIKFPACPKIAATAYRVLGYNIPKRLTNSKTLD